MSALKPYSLKLFLSNKYTYAQIVRKADGHIVAAASTIEKTLQDGLASLSDKTGSSRYVSLM
jgi:ribosomal protein L18